MNILIALVTGSMFAVGIFLLLRRNLVRSLIGLIVLSNAINLFLLATGAFQGSVPPYTNLEGQRADALPQALVLTAIVISMGSFAFITAILSGIKQRYQTADSEEVKGLKH
jgi:multicomponent Na+:H+ antiporter subunit C